MRIVLASLVLALLGSVASAGLKCEKLPAMVWWSETADVHDDGTWHRTTHDKEKQGSLDELALAKFRALAIASRGSADAKEHDAKAAKVVACLDALIANPRGAAATKACAVPGR